MRVIDRIREGIAAGNYELTRHAEEEREEDDIEVTDLELAISNGKIIKKLTHDPRGTRYLILGHSQQKREICIVELLPKYHFGMKRIIDDFVAA